MKSWSRRISAIRSRSNQRERLATGAPPRATRSPAGYTLIEVMVTITVATSLMAVAVLFVQRTMLVSRQIREDAEYQQTIGRLASRLRADIRRAVTVDPSARGTVFHTADPARDGQTFLVLYERSTSGAKQEFVAADGASETSGNIVEGSNVSLDLGRVQYGWADGMLVRERRDQNGHAIRDQFRLPAQLRVRWDQRQVDDRTMIDVSLSLVASGSDMAESSREQVQISAWLGAEQRYSAAKSRSISAGETP
ncbi:MAG: prepilin-type N-terminal cleavage/methylation domain-containing protein [Planctomycetales bacterium]|nr:prepilin-type N-terminal cleavage/methylation domain-containing protein [Planctomycetales bacterium]